MRLFEVQAPTDNPAALAAFETELLDLFGGFSSRTVIGAWRDPSDGRVYDERMKVYHVAYDGEPALTNMVFDHFPGERAVFVAEIGTAQIVARGQPQNLAANAA